ncbi:uncharacterized protein BO97DRAFT_167605 [Aspergillus homomorphus CBS 101889]|uniref:Uncharacterized protein n=1 Tax=Aspergillus homomorphus (strain CBS 101889) TaxID=1450537 RepID=A0A395HPL3_ASPHC|nr:hypothetical protein BO97DRAFT_167605 [Aspergillus homomorphus CBS 101889]RAL09363.1 hypothetical protein BO97DRAFT_167605 [Aspergillus homomorphus CBS 101889]
MAAIVRRRPVVSGCALGNSTRPASGFSSRLFPGPKLTRSSSCGLSRRSTRLRPGQLSGIYRLGSYASFLKIPHDDNYAEDERESRGWMRGGVLHQQGFWWRCCPTETGVSDAAGWVSFGLRNVDDLSRIL